METASLAEIPAQPAEEITSVSTEGLTVEAQVADAAETLFSQPIPISAETPEVASISATPEATLDLLSTSTLPPAVENTEGGLDDFDATFAWLESLAANQGAAEGTLLTTPQQRSVDTPDWIAEQSLESTVSESESIPAFSEESTPPVAQPPIAWQQEAETVSMTSETQEPKPAWPSSSPVRKEDLYTRQLSEDDLQPASPSVAQGPAELHPVSPAPQTGVESEAPDFPDWVKEIEQPAPQFEPVVAQIDQIQPTPSSSVEEPIPDLPFWLVEAQPSNQPNSGTVPATDIEPLPAWLQDFDTQVDPQASQVSDESLSVTTWLSQKTLQDFEEKQGKNQAVEVPQVTRAPVDSIPILEKQATLELPLEQPVIQESPARFERVIEPSQSIPESLNPLLVQAKNAVDSGQPEIAADLFTQVVNQGKSMAETISSLQDALYRYPVDISLWQTLGDAYFRNNQIQEALNSYTKAEELLK
jgi:hypothetical protein